MVVGWSARREQGRGLGDGQDPHPRMLIRQTRRGGISCPQVHVRGWEGARKGEGGGMSDLHTRVILFPRVYLLRRRIGGGESYVVDR